jgi:P27 family predicted phage terminase small subunit
MAAPTPRPARLRLLNGRSEGRDSGGRLVKPPPRFVREAPEKPPDWFDVEARAEWDRIVPGLEALDILKPEDRAMLSVYCVTWSRYVAAVKQYRTEGITLVNPGSRRVHKHPAVGVAEVAGSQLRTFAAEFGLTPSAEQRLVVATSETDNCDDPFA